VAWDQGCALHLVESDLQEIRVVRFVPRHVSRKLISSLLRRSAAGQPHKQTIFCDISLSSSLI
jgi:hypothetical protein